MSTCRYYLQGHCRFGNDCRYSHDNSNQPPRTHPQNPSYRPRHPRPVSNAPIYRYVNPLISNSNSHGLNANTSQTSLKFQNVVDWVKKTFPDKEEALDILQEIQKEAKVWQKSEHLWRFTSRSLFPGGQPLPDWQDYSFEEVKWSYRHLSEQNQVHVYKKGYNDYYENTVRQLHELATLKLDRLKLLTDYIRQYIASGHKPSKTLITDVEMRNSDAPVTVTMELFRPSDSTNYTPDDELLEDERAAYRSDVFEFGQIPAHAPSRELC